MRRLSPAVVMIVVGTMALALTPARAEAYIGPGAGLSAIGALVSLVAAVVVGIVGFVWYPIKRTVRLIKSRFGRKGQDVVAESRRT